MKCPYCDNGVSRYSAPGFRWPCTICDGTGEITPDEMLDKHTKQKTNEAWFGELSTEEKAKVIVDLGRKQRFPRDVEVEFCEQWLKEGHTIEE